MTILWSYGSPNAADVLGIAIDSGNLWISDDNTDSLLRLEPVSGTVLETLPDPTPGLHISGLAAGPRDTDLDGGQEHVGNVR